MTELLRDLRGLPDLVAFWLDAWVIRVEDRRRLSPPVFDAWWWR